MSQPNLTDSQREIIKNLQENKEIFYPIDLPEIQDLVERDYIRVVKDGEYELNINLSQRHRYKLVNSFNGWESERRYFTMKEANLDANYPSIHAVPAEWTWKYNEIAGSWEWAE